jgi:hypothetical protein
VWLVCLLAAEAQAASAVDGVGGSHLNDAIKDEFERSQGPSINEAAIKATFSPTAAPTAGKWSQCSVLYCCSSACSV